MNSPAATVAVRIPGRVARRHQRVAEAVLGDVRDHCLEQFLPGGCLLHSGHRTMWYMRALHVSIDIPQDRDEVYGHFDVLANHERFSGHMMRNWRLSGPPRVVGPQATVVVVLGRRTDAIEIEVIEAEAPVRYVERNVGAAGRRVATGTYTLEALPGGQTRINSDYAWQQAPLGERLAAPLVRRAMHPAIKTAMQRLAEQLATHG